MPPPTEDATRPWTFLSNHAHALICIAADPTIRMRDVAVRLGITERAVQRIVAELADAGYLVVTRDGRRNRYEVDGDRPLRHPLTAHRTARQLMELGLGGRPRR
jgi:Mn-dependent DtxR family transcriptional regulator